MSNLSNIHFQLPSGGQGTTIRILPSKQGGKLFHAYRIHRLCSQYRTCHKKLVNGEWARDGGQKWDGSCDYCSLYTSLWQQQKVQEAREIKPLDRFSYNIISRQDNKGPLVFTMGKVLHTLVIRAMCGDIDSPSLGDVTNYKTGRDFTIRRKMHTVGPQMYPSYDESRFLRPSVAGTKEEWEYWMASLHALDSLVRVEDRATVQKIIAEHMGVGVIKPKKKSRTYRSLDDEWEV